MADSFMQWCNLYFAVTTHDIGSSFSVVHVFLCIYIYMYICEYAVHNEKGGVPYVNNHSLNVAVTTFGHSYVQGKPVGTSFGM